MNKITRFTSAATAGVLTVCALSGCSPYSNPGITVPEKGAVTLKKSDIDKAYEDAIKDILEGNYRDTKFVDLEDANETVHKGDKAFIVYEGRAADESVKLSEETLANMTNKKEKEEDTVDHELIIGSNSFIGAYESDEEGKSTEGFEDQLIGWKAGQEGEIKVTFPDDYDDTAELQGVAVIFKVKVNKIARAYVEDDCKIKVSYEFEEKTEDEDKKDESEDKKDESGDQSEASAASEGDTTTGSDDSKDPETGDGEDEDEEDEKPAIGDVFKSGNFEIDYTEGVKDDATFNDLFLVKDHAEEFKKHNLYEEFTFSHTVTEDDAKKKDSYKDYVGRTVEVKMTITELTSLPEWTDELVAEYTSDDYKTVADFEKFTRTSLTANLALEAIVKATEVKEWPEKELEKIYREYVDNLVYQQLQADPSTMTQKELDAILTDEVYAQIYASAATSALTQLKQTLVYEYLFDYYDIKLSGKEYREQRDAMYESSAMYLYYYGVYDVKGMEKYYGKDNLELQFKANKLAEVLDSYVTVDENS